MKKLVLALAFGAASIFTANAQFQIGGQLGLNRVSGGDYDIDAMNVINIGVRAGGVATERVAWQASVHYGLPAQVKINGEKLEDFKYNYFALQGRANLFVAGVSDEGFGFYIPVGATLNFGSFKGEGITGEEGFSPFVPTIDVGLGLNYILDSEIGVFGEVTYGLPGTLNAGSDDNQIEISEFKTGGVLGFNFGVFKQF